MKEGGTVGASRPWKVKMLRYSYVGKSGDTRGNRKSTIYVINRDLRRNAGGNRKSDDMRFGRELQRRSGGNRKSTIYTGGAQPQSFYLAAESQIQSNTLHHLPPSFFIIGERKCATSSLYRYLIEHPQILPCRVKEPQFFSRPWWYRLLFASRYRALFPKLTDRKMNIEWMDLNREGKIVKETLTFQRDPGETIITGEASANSFAQVPPKRLKLAYPEAKLILCLRHPVDRAHSHYRMLERFAAEGRRIPFRMQDFASDFRDDLARMKSGGGGYFAGISFYADRMKSWAGVFGLMNIYIVRTEDLNERESAQRILTELCRFLGIRGCDFKEVLSMKVNESALDTACDPGLRKHLFEHYAGDVQALEEFTGRKFNWNP